MGWGAVEDLHAGKNADCSTRMSLVSSLGIGVESKERPKQKA